MEARRPLEHTLEVFADPSCVKDVVKALLHTIFFHRYWVPIEPRTRDLLDTTLPSVDDVDLETMIDERATTLVRALENSPLPASNNSPGGGPGYPSGVRPSSHAHTVQPHNVSGYGNMPGGIGGGVGEMGIRAVTHGATGQSGRAQIVVQFLEKKKRKTYFSFGKEEEVIWEQWTLDVTTAIPRTDTEVAKVRRAMEKSLQKTAMKVINIVNRDLDHIPPILTSDSNPFPHHIIVNPRRDDGQFGGRIGGLF